MPRDDLGEDMGELIGCIFAGGQGRRLGGRDKALIELAGRPLWQYAAQHLQPHALEVIATAMTLPVWCEAEDAPRHLPDWLLNGKTVGPVGGVLAALEYARETYGLEACVLTVPVDAPFFPDSLFARLPAALGDGMAAIAESPARLQPAFGIWSAKAVEEIATMVREGEFALRAIAGRLGAKRVAFETDAAFFNINTPKDLQEAEERARELAGGASE